MQPFKCVCGNSTQFTYTEKLVSIKPEVMNAIVDSTNRYLVLMTRSVFLSMYEQTSKEICFIEYFHSFLSAEGLSVSDVKSALDVLFEVFCDKERTFSQSSLRVAKRAIVELGKRLAGMPHSVNLIDIEGNESNSGKLSSPRTDFDPQVYLFQHLVKAGGVSWGISLIDIDLEEAASGDWFKNVFFRVAESLTDTQCTFLLAKVPWMKLADMPIKKAKHCVKKVLPEIIVYGCNRKFYKLVLTCAEIIVVNKYMLSHAYHSLITCVITTVPISFFFVVPL